MIMETCTPELQEVQCEMCALHCIDTKLCRFHFKTIVYDGLDEHQFCSECNNLVQTQIQRYEQFHNELGSDYESLREKLHVEGTYDFVKNMRFRELAADSGLKCDLCLKVKETNYLEFDFDVSCELASVNGDFCIDCSIYLKDISERYQEIFHENKKEYNKYMKQRNLQFWMMMQNQQPQE